MLYEACKNLGNYNHWIGYWYGLVNELKYLLIGYLVQSLIGASLVDIILS